MAIQAARELLAVSEVPGDPDRLRVTMRLLCGCEIIESVPRDRVRDTALGERIVVGKYACPEGHPTGGQACGSGLP